MVLVQQCAGKSSSFLRNISSYTSSRSAKFPPQTAQLREAQNRIAERRLREKQMMDKMAEQQNGLEDAWTLRLVQDKKQWLTDEFTRLVDEEWELRRPPPTAPALERERWAGGKDRWGLEAKGRPGKGLPADFFEEDVLEDDASADEKEHSCGVQNSLAVTGDHRKIPTRQETLEKYWSYHDVDTYRVKERLWSRNKELFDRYGHMLDPEEAEARGFSGTSSWGGGHHWWGKGKGKRGWLSWADLERLEEERVSVEQKTNRISLGHPVLTGAADHLVMGGEVEMGRGGGDGQGSTVGLGGSLLESLPWYQRIFLEVMGMT